MNLTFHYAYVKSNVDILADCTFTIEVSNHLGHLLNEQSIDYLYDWSAYSYKAVNPDYLHTGIWFKENIGAYYHNVAVTPLATHNLVSSYSLEYAIHYYYNVANFKQTHPEIYV